MREREIVAILKQLTLGNHQCQDLLAELDTLLEPTWIIPASVMLRVREEYPGNSIRGFCSRANHAYYVWNEKYGPMNQEQTNYVTLLFNSVLTSAAGDRGKMLGRMEDIVNHEDVDAGFKRRATNIAVDVAQEIQASLDRNLTTGLSDALA